MMTTDEVCIVFMVILLWDVVKKKEILFVFASEFPLTAICSILVFSQYLSGVDE